MKTQNSPQLKVSKSKWEKEFSSGRWDILDTEPAERARSAVIAMYCKCFSPKGRILDVGCGLGTVVDFLTVAQKRRYLGIDISTEAIERANYKKANFIAADFSKYKVESKFDIIIFNEVLYYMDHEKALKRASRMLVDGGRLIVSIYRTKQRHDREIWNITRNFFNPIEAVQISRMIGRRSTWRIEVLEPFIS